MRDKRKGKDENEIQGDVPAPAVTPAPATITCQYQSNTNSFFSHNGTEYNLVKGETYQLPADSDVVKGLIAFERLIII